MAAVAVGDASRIQFNAAFDRRIREAETPFDKTTLKISRYIWQHCDLPNPQNPKRTKAKSYLISGLAKAGAFFHTLGTCGFQCRQPEPRETETSNHPASTES